MTERKYEELAAIKTIACCIGMRVIKSKTPGDSRTVLAAIDMEMVELQLAIGIEMASAMKLTGPHVDNAKGFLRQTS